MDREPSPPEPSTAPGTPAVWYRGWECSWNGDAHFWTSEGWDAYKGGCDLGAPRISAKTWGALLDEIDDAEGD